MVRILLCGDVRGNLKAVSKQVEKLHAKLPADQQFQAVFCVGEFTAEEMDLDVKPPVPVYFIDCGPACQDLIDETPQGDELSPNLHFLGHYGVANVHGLKVAFLSGKHRADLFEPDNDDDEDQELPQAQAPASALDRYGAQNHGDEGLHARLQPLASSGGGGGGGSAPQSIGPSWEDLKKKEKEKEELMSQLFIEGCYTPLAVERLCEDIDDSGGIDLLLTSEWPAGCMRGLKDAWPQEVETRRLAKQAARQCSAPGVSEVASAAEPKYHATGLGGVFWRRVPWKHEKRGEVVQSTGELKCGVCRMITLGAVDGSRPGVKEDAASSSGAYTYRKPEEAGASKPQKWLHGLELDPHAVPAQSDDATTCPWSAKADAEAKARAEAAANAPAERPDFSGMDKEEKRRWMQRFGMKPEEMLFASDKLAKENAPKEKKEKHKSLYKVSEKEKKRRKTGGDGHLPFQAKERMHGSGRG
eukprot:TRINITY_DN20934_c0_g1_i1.p1 TRINITY_DN20934_c0_g1~~TRINITY_DN20934_c0_g1_i1.p1  ORF type:complete len:472 (+),score=126.75 TRINITY_DN20934_c0_g1_i1:64-1479(+)